MKEIGGTLESLAGGGKDNGHSVENQRWEKIEEEREEDVISKKRGKLYFSFFFFILQP